ncbi:hypothetical protein PCE1_001155 [Barthelona sp. PCE]
MPFKKANLKDESGIEGQINNRLLFPDVQIDILEDEVDIFNQKDLDSHISDIYFFFCQRGYVNVLSNQFYRVIKALCTTFLAFVMIYWIVWPKIAELPEVHEFHFSEILSKHPISRMSIFGKGMFIAFILYSLKHLFTFCLHIPRFWRVRNTYIHKLGIDISTLDTMKWSELVEKLIAAKLIKSDVEVASRLMRIENIQMSCFHEEVLPTYNCTIFPKFQRYICYSSAFDHNMNVKYDYSADKMRKRCKWIVVLTFLFFPLLFLFRIMQIAFTFGEELKSNPGNAAKRIWSPLARIRLKNYNELEHQFRLRLSLSYGIARRYFDSFPSFFLDNIMAFLAYIVGGFALVLVLGTVGFGEKFSSLLLLNRSFFFWLTTLAAVLASLRITSPSNPDFQTESSSLIRNQPDLYLRKLLELLHHVRVREDHMHSVAVMKELEPLFPMMFIYLLQEVMNPLLLPFRLLDLLSKIDRVHDHLERNSVVVEGSGTMSSSSLIEHVRTDSLAASKSLTRTDIAALSFSVHHPRYAFTKFQNLEEHDEIDVMASTTEKEKTQQLKDIENVLKARSLEGSIITKRDLNQMTNIAKYVINQNATTPVTTQDKTAVYSDKNINVAF